MRRIIAITGLVILALCGEAWAKAGDTYRCVMKDFDAHSVDAPRDVSFEVAVEPYDPADFPVACCRFHRH